MAARTVVSAVLCVQLLASTCVRAIDRSALAFDEQQQVIQLSTPLGCNSKPSDETVRAPGIGFALQVDHGTVAIRLHDGTVHDIAMRKGDDRYISLMRRLSIDPANRFPDHYNTTWEKLRYVKSRAQRLVNKLVGRPATPETAILASMVSSLVEATREFLEQNNISAAVLSSPDHIRLTHEELGDVFDYLRIQNLMRPSQSLYELYATSAAYAGYGQGLCRNYTNAYECKLEESRMPTQRILHLDFGFKHLSGTLKTMESARSPSMDQSFVDFNLGLGQATGDDDLDQQYWASVINRIHEFAKFYRARYYMPHVSEILLTGPAASDEQFKAVIKTALRDLVVDESVLASLEYSDGIARETAEWTKLFNFVTARGAAEFAKRRQEGQCSY